MKRGFRKDTAEEGGMCGYERERVRTREMKRSEIKREREERYAGR